MYSGSGGESSLLSLLLLPPAAILFSGEKCPRSLSCNNCKKSRLSPLLSPPPPPLTSFFFWAVAGTSNQSKKYPSRCHVMQRSLPSSAVPLQLELQRMKGFKQLQWLSLPSCQCPQQKPLVALSSQRPLFFTFFCAVLYKKNKGFFFSFVSHLTSKKKGASSSPHKQDRIRGEQESNTFSSSSAPPSTWRREEVSQSVLAELTGTIESFVGRKSGERGGGGGKVKEKEAPFLLLLPLSSFLFEETALRSEESRSEKQRKKEKATKREREAKRAKHRDPFNTGKKN